VEERKDVEFLRERILELEEKVEQLRLSRRVLMNLIEKIEKERVGFLTRLERENRKLQKNNYRYAKSLLHKNRQIVELESKLRNGSSQNLHN
jgi:predicted RNase H-like nuclease (RuvC/YqgF family)